MSSAEAYRSLASTGDFSWMQQKHLLQCGPFIRPMTVVLFDTFGSAAWAVCIAGCAERGRIAIARVGINLHDILKHMEGQALARNTVVGRIS